jgi:hypothetical protein
MFNVKSRRYDMREKLYGSCCIRDNMLCQERAGCSNCMIWLQWQLDTMPGACYICRHNQGCEIKAVSYIIIMRSGVVMQQECLVVSLSSSVVIEGWMWYNVFGRKNVCRQR